MMSTVASPPSGSPIRNPDSLYEPPGRLVWEGKRDKMWTALADLFKMQKLLEGVDVTSLDVLRNELESLGQFYSFLMNTSGFVDTDERGYFSVLPEELIHQIFTFLDHISLLKMSQVCTKFREMERDDSLWENICFRNEIPPEEKVEGKSWKWMALSRLRVWPEKARRNGPGTWYYEQKEEGGTTDSYIGDWEDDKRSGYGVYRWVLGSSYSGNWKDDQRSGFGIRLWPNGNKYIGEYKYHKRHGNGEFTFTNGSVFRGQFNENKFTQGTYTWPNGRVYTGQWNNVYRHGHGHYLWPDGRTYRGEWRKDKRHGEGIYTWSDGDIFVGQFVDGKRMGNGVLKLATGEIYRQIWKEDRFDEQSRGLNGGNDVILTRVEDEDELISIRKMIEAKLEQFKSIENTKEEEDKDDSVDSSNDNSMDLELRKKRNFRKRKIEAISTSQPVLSDGEDSIVTAEETTEILDIDQNNNENNNANNNNNEEEMTENTTN
eukprot:TRINITY_DN3492_c0_g1_i1.p1 TRINITY_DN3492_c0_g1~~TRINITY_DN3492_c0_g1_i1.p1  ORF type:complete len:488 (-),score=176.86 TRINITY_DN3492_c0_g1_i1:108-1571(-)